MVVFTRFDGIFTRFDGIFWGIFTRFDGKKAIFTCFINTDILYLCENIFLYD
jgi:hypothetical protein